MQPNISKTIFYSLLFAMGGAPTIAMLLMLLQHVESKSQYQIFIGLTVVIACVLVPAILIQNAFLILKRHHVKLEQRIKPLVNFYLLLNILCLVFWIAYQFRHSIT